MKDRRITITEYFKIRWNNLFVFFSSSSSFLACFKITSWRRFPVLRSRTSTLCSLCEEHTLIRRTPSLANVQFYTHRRFNGHRFMLLWIQVCLTVRVGPAKYLERKKKKKEHPSVVITSPDPPPDSLLPCLVFVQLCVPAGLGPVLRTWSNAFWHTHLARFSDQDSPNNLYINTPSAPKHCLVWVEG